MDTFQIPHDGGIRRIVAGEDDLFTKTDTPGRNKIPKAIRLSKLGHRRFNQRNIIGAGVLAYIILRKL